MDAIATVGSQVLSERQANQHLTDTIAQYLTECAATNKQVTYKDLNELTHIDVQSANGRYYLKTARSRLAAKGIHFKTVQKIGLNPMTQGEAVQAIGVDARHKIGGAVSNWGAKFRTIDPHKLNQNDLRQYLKEGVSLSVHEDLVSQKTTQRIDAVVDARKQQELLREEMKKMIIKTAEEYRSL